MCTVDGTPTGMPGTDCNDTDPNVNPRAVENCTNGVDDNCNMRVDFADDACVASNDTCAAATVVPPTGGTFNGSTRGLRDDYRLSCNPDGLYADAAYVITLTEPHDITAAINVSDPGAGIAIVSGCTAPISEVRCNATGEFGVDAPSVHARSLPAGTYYILVETGTPPGPFRLDVMISAPTTVPLEDACPTSDTAPAAVLTDGVPQTAHLSMLEDDHSLSCNDTSGGPGAPDAVYRFTLTAASDVRIVGTAVSGSTFVNLRRSPCSSSGSDLRCVPDFFGGSTTTVSQRNLMPGTYYVLVENDETQDVTVTLNVTSPPAPVVTYTMSEPAGLSFVDVCSMTSVRRVVLADADEEYAQIPETTGTPLVTIPFQVRYFGLLAAPPYSVNANGFIALDVTDGDPQPAFDIPDTPDPNFLIAGLWDDLTTRSTGVCYGVVGTAPNRQFVVEWNDAEEYFDDTQHLTFEVIINEAPAGSSNVIDIAYQQLVNFDSTFSFALGGIENEDGTGGISLGFDFFAPRYVRFTPH
jgi:hypothetical protein